MMNKVSVIISDWQILVREGISFILSGEEDVIITGKAAGIDEAQKLIEDSPPDVAILDVRKNDPSGWEIIQSLKRDLPNVSFVFILDVFNEDRVFTVIKSGANGCIFNNSTPGEVRKIVRTAGNKGYQTSSFLLIQGIAAKTIEEFEKDAAGDTYLSGLLARLTPRENEILQRVKNDESVDNAERFLESIRVKLVNNQRYHDIFNAVELHNAALTKLNPNLETRNTRPDPGTGGGISQVNRINPVQDVDKETGRYSGPRAGIEDMGTINQAGWQAGMEPRMQNAIEEKTGEAGKEKFGHPEPAEASVESFNTEDAGSPILTKETVEQIQPEQKDISGEYLVAGDNVTDDSNLDLPVNTYQAEDNSVAADKADTFKDKEKRETEEKILEEEDWQAIFKAKKEALEKILVRNDVVQEGLASGIYEGTVELLILPPTSQNQIRLFQEYLVQIVPNLRIILSGGSSKACSEIVIYLGKQVNFIGCLRQIPIVSQITKRGKKLWIKLTD